MLCRANDMENMVLLTKSDLTTFLEKLPTQMVIVAESISVIL